MGHPGFPLVARESGEIETDRQSQLQEGNELMHEARLKLGLVRSLNILWMC